MNGKCLLSADAYIWLHVDVIEQPQVCRQCICHVEMQQASLLFDTTVMMFYIKLSTLDSHPLSYSFYFHFGLTHFPFTAVCIWQTRLFWDNGLCFQLKPAEDLLGQETREKERDGDQYLDNKQERMIEVIQSGLDVDFALWGIFTAICEAHGFTSLCMWALWVCDHWTGLSSAAQRAQKNCIANQKLDSSAAVIKCAGSACSPACLCCTGSSR